MKHWVITGAGRGIGLELTQQLCAAGERVTAIVRSPDRAVKLKELSRKSKFLKILQADVTKDIDIAAAATQLKGLEVNVLINNAGIYLEDGVLPELDLKMVEETFQVNVLGPIRTTKMFLPNLLKATQPIIVNISSQMGSIDDNGSGRSYAYRMSKAALNMFTKNLSLEFPRAIVLALHPGWVKTDMGGSSAPTEPKDSVAGLLNVIKSAQFENSGSFLNFKGEKIEW